MFTTNPGPSPADSVENAQPESAIEQRATYRFAVDELAELRLDQRRFKGRLVDSSAGGFAFVVDDDRQIQIGACGELHGPSGAYQVEVVYKAVMDARVRAGKRACFRIGVRRLRDIAVPEPDDRTTRGVTGWLQMSRPGPGSASSIVYTTIAVLLIVVVGIMYAISADDPDNTSAPDPAGQVAGNWKTNPNNPKPGSKPVNVPGSGHSFWRWLWGKNSTLDRDGLPALSPDVLKRLRQPTALLDLVSIPEAVRQLNLSDAQQAVMRQISQAAQRTLTELAKRGDGNAEEFARQRDKVLEAARQKTERLLTAQQRAQWAQLGE